MFLICSFFGAPPEAWVATARKARVLWQSLTERFRRVFTPAGYMGQRRCFGLGPQSTKPSRLEARMDA